MAAERRRVALELRPGERTTALILAAAAAIVATALTSPWDGEGTTSFVLLTAAAAILGGAAAFGNRFVTAIGAALVALNPGWGLLFILASPYLALAIVLAYRARRDFDNPAE